MIEMGPAAAKALTLSRYHGTIYFIKAPWVLPANDVRNAFPRGRAMNKFMTLDRFRYVFVAYIIFASFKTLILAPQIVGSHPAHPLVAQLHIWVLASVEILAASALLVVGFRKAAAFVLLIVFAAAGGLDLLLGEAPAHLVLYAAATMLLAGKPSVIADSTTPQG